MTEGGTRELYAALFAKLRPFVARRVPPSDVDDVVQNVFLRVHRGLSDVRDEERLGPWVYQIARNVIVDHQRGNSRLPVPADNIGDDAPAPASPSGDLSEELATFVVPFVAMLPSPYREALTLTEIQGLSQKDAAEMLGVSLPAMKSRVLRGREKLRALFDACCDIAFDSRGRVVDCEPRPQGAMPNCVCGPKNLRRHSSSCGSTSSIVRHLPERNRRTITTASSPRYATSHIAAPRSRPPYTRVVSQAPGTNTTQPRRARAHRLNDVSPAARSASA